MSVARFSEPAAEEARRRETEQFLLMTVSAIERMRQSVPQLEKGDQATWQELRFASHNLVEKAAKLEVGIVGACAKEIEKLAEEKFAGAVIDDFFMLCATSAIETLSMEVKRLRTEAAS
jgi:hypothetical protein